MARQTPLISISVNGGAPNASDDNVTKDSIVLLENTDKVNVESYVWKLVSKPPGSSASLSSISWNLKQDGSSLENVEATAVAIDTTTVELPIRATGVTSVKVQGDPTNYFTGLAWLDSNGFDIHLDPATPLPGGTADVIVVIAPINPATSFVADEHGTYIIALTLNRWLKGSIGASVRSQHLDMRLPGKEERNEFNGWSTAVYDSLIALEDGYATVAAATGSGAVGGDLDGSLPNPTVVGIQGRSISSSAPTTDQALSWNGASWSPATVLISGSTAGGDLDGTYPNPTVTRIHGRDINPTAPTPNQVLSWSSADGYWAPRDPGTPSAHSSTHEYGGGDEIDVTNLSGVLADPQDAGSLRGYTVSSSAPSSGQVLSWNGAQWAPAAPASSSHTMGGAQHIADTLASINTKVSDANLIGTTTAAGQDLSGTYPNPTVIRLQGRDVDAAAPALSEVLTWDGSKWSPQSGGGPPSGAASGDLSGTYPSPTVAAIQGYDVDSSAPSSGDVLVWSIETNEWVPEAQSGGGVGHYLVFSDDTEFTESGTTAVAKKTFRLVIPSGRENDQWLAVVSLWVTGGYGDTAECIARIGDGVSTWDSTTFTTTNGTETVFQQLINVNDPPETPGDIIYVEFTLRVTTGTDVAHLKYTDLYAIFN